MSRAKKERQRKRIEAQQRRERKISQLNIKIKQLQIAKQEQIITNIKNMGIRNLRLCKHTLKFIVPYAVTIGITVSGFKLCAGGLPFHKDDVARLGRTDLTSNASEGINMQKKYVIYNWFTDALPKSHLKIIYPYQEVKGLYVRIIRDYNVSVTKELIEAVIKEDTGAIESLLSKYEEEIETTNELPKEPFKEEIDAELHFVDTEDKIVFSESNLKNNVITGIELVIFLVIAVLITKLREFDYLEAIKADRKTYPVESLSYFNNEINTCLSRIRILKKGGN